ncbi:MAG: histidine--tRNA ligase [Pseudomonadota bacterium]
MSSKEGDGEGHIKAVKGMPDLLPPASRRMAKLEAISHRVLRTYGYAEIRTPVVEYTPLFARSIGDTSDIVEKEMYTFLDRDERSLTLRPEGTAGIARAYIEHAINKIEPATSWYYLGPMFRHERAQRGRYRQFFQLGAEFLGVESPSADAEMLAMLAYLLGEMGLESAELHLNSLGCQKCRPEYRQKLIEYLKPRKSELCEDCSRRFVENPLRVLDCKKDECTRVSGDAPQTLELICPDCKEHWEGVLLDLETLQVDFEVNHRLVRGLDYYTRTTFEIIGNTGELGTQNTLGGGGRYDCLIEQLGGEPTPAVGFALGLERILLALPTDRPVLSPLAQVFVVTRGEEARRSALPLVEALRREGISTVMDLRQGSVKSQMKRADRLGSELALILGEQELQKGLITLRRMSASEQEEVPRQDVVPRLLAILKEEGQ